MVVGSNPTWRAKIQENKMLQFLLCLFGLHGATEIDYTIDDEEIKVCRDCLKECWDPRHFGCMLPNVLRHIRPRWDNKLGGVFLFLLVDVMADKVQAKKDLEFCSAELSKYQNLSRSGLTRDEMLAIDGIMIKLKERVKNLRTTLCDN